MFTYVKFSLQRYIDGYLESRIAGEITEREPCNGYLIYKGRLPEVEEFIAKYVK